MENIEMIGGPGHIINLDESMFRHKPKYHRGRATDHEIWVFGIVDSSYVPAKGLMFVVPNRSSQTLLPIIQQHVIPGSIIYTDEWRAYNNISNAGFEHHTINHSLMFVNHETGIHTQFIESYWAKQKQRQKTMKGIRGKKLSEYLAMFNWWDNVCQKNFQKVIELIKLFNYLLFFYWGKFDH